MMLSLNLTILLATADVFADWGTLQNNILELY